MRSTWTAAPGLLLILWATGAWADEPSWHASPTASAAATDNAVDSSSILGRPVAAEEAPVVSLGQPRAAGAAPTALDGQVLQATYSASLGTPESLIARGKAPDAPLPLPLGDPIKGPPILDTPAEPSNVTPNVAKNPPMLDGVLADGASCTCGGDACCVPCDGGCGECDCCCPNDPYTFWLRPEYLLWSIRSDHTPPLVTTGPQASLGALGQPGTQVLFGGDLDRGEFSGGRFTAGMWLDPQMEWGVEGSIFFLGQRSDDFNAFSPGNPVLARPITSPTGASGVEQIANLAEVINGVPVLPTFGSVTVHAPSEMWGAELNGIMGLWRDSWGRLDLLGGFRYASLQEAIDINENVTIAANSPVFAGTNFLVSDTFNTHNEFYGGQLGLRSELYWGNWQLDLTGKIAIGETHEKVDINGVTGIAPPGTVPTFFQGGLLALPTNIGTYSRDRFAVLPELGLNVGYQLSPHWRIFVGYDVMWWSHVARPGEEIDTVVNPTQVPRFGGSAATLVGPARPAFVFNDSSFWAQGANFGVEFRY